MNAMLKTRSPWPIVIGSALWSIAAAALLYYANFGINVSILTAIGTGLFMIVIRHTDQPISRVSQRMLVVAAAFGLLFALRAAPGVQIANWIAILTALGAAMFFARQPSTEVPWLRAFFMPLTQWDLAIKNLFGFLDQLSKNPESRRKGDVSRQVTSGLLFAAPLLLIFTALFSGADANFRRHLESLATMNWDTEALTGSTLIFVAAFMSCAGLLITFTRAKPEPPPIAEVVAQPRQNPQNPQKFALGQIEVGTILTCLVSLFSIFIAIQFESFFGGQATVNKIDGLTSAGYAREGFFQLVTVAALCLGTILGLDSLTANQTTASTWLNRGLIGLTFLVIASALMRMNLYTYSFGLSELRIYTTAFMVWIAGCFVWLIPTVTRGRPDRFGFGAIVMGLGVIGALNIVNPEGLIARYNVLHRNRDLAHIASLSSDAEATWRADERLNSADRLKLAELELKNQRPDDWRSGRSPNS
jgi:hypothetical protein